VAIMSLFNVTLEGPQNGIIFWVLIGAALRVVQLAQAENAAKVPIMGPPHAVQSSER